MFKKLSVISILLCLCSSAVAQEKEWLNFFGDSVVVPFKTFNLPAFNKPITQEGISSFYNATQQSGFDTIAVAIEHYRRQQKLDDWLFYQLIRFAAEKFSAKAANYERYTLLKWYLLNKTGFTSILSITPEKMLLYVQSNDEVFEIPYRIKSGKQFTCLNYHDYGFIDFEKEQFDELSFGSSAPGRPFSYKITNLPEFKSQSYTVKELEFDYYQQDYKFKVLVNPHIQRIFANYPILNYSYYFDIPLSRTTYGSLIPLLKQQLQHLDEKKGVDYLMRFTRQAFGFETDTKQFGKEKRLTPEQTLLYNQSDCEDRAAFFFYLVKEIYGLPMIVLCYPKHVTVAVAFKKAVSNQPIRYKGRDYYVCEATPQKKDLKIGHMLPQYRNSAYEVVYEYSGKMP